MVSIHSLIAPLTNAEVNVRDYKKPIIQDLIMAVAYPKSVFLICINEYFERFSFYGIRTTLPIFLKDGIGYEEDTATVIFHLFFMFSYFTPLIGATVSDCFIGNYRTIIYFTLVYIVGSGLLSLSVIPVNVPVVAFAAIGLALIALGAGGIKPCISTFGGDQFKLPEQEDHQLRFFAAFNWIIAAANLSATFFAPMLRSQVSCFGESSCFSLMFIVALAFLVLSLVFLVAGRKLYFLKKPQGNILVRVAKCVSTAISHKFKNLKVRKDLNNAVSETQIASDQIHWLDTAVEKHGVELVADIKIVSRLLPLYVPLCFFWALYDQQSSRWTFQASRMNRSIFGFTIEPDQFQVTHRLLLLILIPVFEKCIYPPLRKYNILANQLSRMFWGGIFAAAAFLLSGVLEIYLKGSTTEDATIHITWQLPQFLAIVIAEIMFQISGMEFSYSEAPHSMKSLLQSIWLLTSAVGNLIVVLVARFKFFDEQEYEFFLFAGLMFVNMLLFAVISLNYKKLKFKAPRPEIANEGVINEGFQKDDP